MPKPKHIPIEYRNYSLPPHFPIILLTGEAWRISDVRHVEQHFHNCLEIGFCETDSGIIEFSGTAHKFKAGDITFVASDIPHTTYSDPGTASKWSYLFVNVEMLFSPYFPLDIISEGGVLQKLLHNYCAVLPREEYPEIYMLTKAIIEELKEKKLNFQFSVRGLMLSLMMKLINLYLESEKKDSENFLLHENSLSIAPALSHIRKNYMLDFPIESLAEMCHMSPSHFRRTFSSIMGFGALEYVIRIRITHATIMLRTTELPILNVSEEVGFHSLSSFNRHFMEIVGKTPSEYRKLMTSVTDRPILRCTGWMLPPKEQ